MRDLATYHFATRQAALDFVAACDELEIPAGEPTVREDKAPFKAHVLLAHVRHNRDYLDGLAGSKPASYEVGRCPFAWLAESEPSHAKAFARCFIAANTPAQFWSCCRFARHAELLPHHYCGGTYFAAPLRFDNSSYEFLNGAFDEWRGAAWSYLEGLQVMSHELEPMQGRYWPDARDDFGRPLPRAAVSCDLQSTPYFAALERASFYRWKAQRRQMMPGNDPITGQSRKRYAKHGNRVIVEESRVAHKALARYWLTMARRLRLASHFSQCQF